MVRRRCSYKPIPPPPHGCVQVNVKGMNNVRVVVKTFSFAQLKEKLRSAQESGVAMAM